VSGARKRGVRAALAVGLLLTATACRIDRSCAADVCTDGTVRHAGSSAAWTVRGDDGRTYEVKPGLPTLFQREGLRVRVVGRKHSGRGAGGARPIDLVRIETVPGR